MPALHVFLSPHLDDAVLSCGGTIARLSSEGHRVLVVTVFAQGKRGALSPFARRHLRIWDAQEDAMRLRQQEDREALALLGAEAWHGQYADAPFRRHPVDGRWLYTSDKTLFGLPDPSEGDFPHRIAGEVSTILVQPPKFIYVPLGLGRHVDHVHVAAAGHILARAGYPVLWYEEYPYAAQMQRRSRPGWHALISRVREQDVERKMQAILRYRSQIPSLFGHPKEVARRVGDYMRSVSGYGYYAERFWQRT